MRELKTILRLLFLLVIIMAVNASIWAQVAVERSNEKVVISGVAYYLHIVKKGETVYSISKAYGITSEELIRENPPAVNGLKEGQSIRIPERLISTAPSSKPGQPDNRIRDEEKFIYHKLQPGETIYFLSKKYSVSEYDIIQSNSGIDINKLPLGYEIAIPRKELMNEKQAFENQDSKAYYHKVAKGETMSSIAHQYGLTVKALRRENRESRFPQVGDYLKIPGMKPKVEIPAEQPLPDTIQIPGDDEVIYMERPPGFTTFKSLKGSFDVAVLLPFYLVENSRRTELDSATSVKGKKVFKAINRQDYWIYPKSLDFVEMYEGILLAADTLRALGLDIKIHTFDVSSDTVELTKLLRSGVLDKMDLIIGPVHSHNLSILASYAGNMGIPVVSPVQLGNNSVLANNPLLFMASSSLEVAQNAIARKMKDYYNSNIVLIHSASESEYRDTDRFRNMILNELSTRMPFEEIKFKDMVFYSRSVFGNDSINRLAHTLSEVTKNVVIIASENPPVMIESLTDIHTLARKLQVNVFGYPNMRYLDNLEHKICFDLGLMIYSQYWIDYMRDDVKAFNVDFRSKFLTEPSESSYAWQGYDILYYFLSGLALNGREFLSHPEIHNPDLLNTEFDFRRGAVTDGFENHRLFLIRYTNDYVLELVNDQEPVTSN